MKSIRFWLIVMLTSAILTSMLGAIFISYNKVSHETEELYDAELAQLSRVLESLLSIQLDYTQDANLASLAEKDRVINTPDVHASGEFDLYGHKYEKKLSFQIWTSQGVFLLGSGHGLDMTEFVRKPGYQIEQDTAGEQWRSFTRYSEPLKVWIKTAQQMEIREELTHEIASLNVQSLLLMLLVMIVLMVIIIQMGFRSLLRVSEEIESRNPSHLAPLDEREVPSEIMPVVHALNQLLGEIDHSIERQQRFTSNAAHELRTPLAAIKVHAQNLYPQDERTQTIQQKIVQGVDKLTHLFNQLITLSKMETELQEEGGRESSKKLLLHGLVDQQLFPLSEQIKVKNLQVDNAVATDLVCTCPENSMSILLRNLIDNAVRYSDENGMIRVTATDSADGMSISVMDTGPGLDEQQKQRVFERFYRAAHQQVTGCGLGLSIVKEIVERQQYRILLHDSPLAEHGLWVELFIPKEINMK
ncbi:sensor histidine kinase N-terminal domain-containing protein [Motilimonas cestriensis]|uniref:histidine kinase n=1 Tax=Motilimonas cestriensis TaxID=2742685 RepID=A0ABS8W6B3_9GAMM|nr:ATP-binding protein [Motilimonas cestriensis]MCE2594524.1 sensor histidine kinase N-terminal domain-containing protein [Motilimonas cestriensis]